MFLVFGSSVLADDLKVTGGNGGAAGDWNGKDGKVEDNDLGTKTEKKGGSGGASRVVPGIGGTASYSSHEIDTSNGDGKDATGSPRPGAGGGGGAAVWESSSHSAKYDAMRITGGDSNSGGGGDALVAIWENAVEIAGNVYITTGEQKGLLPAGSASLHHDGGTLAIGGQIILENKSLLPLITNATYHMTDGALEITSGYNGNNKNRNIFDDKSTLIKGTIKIDGDKDKTFVVHSGNYATLNQAVEGGGKFFKDGSGTLILSKENTYTGDTFVDGGILQVGDKDGNGTIGTEDGAGHYLYDKGLAVGKDASIIFNKNSYTLAQVNGILIKDGGSLVFQNSTGDNFLESDVTLWSGAHLRFDTPGEFTNTANGLISGYGDVIAQGIGSKTILTENNTYSGKTIVGEYHELELQGLLGAKSDEIGIYDGEIKIDGTLTFNKTDTAGPTRIQVLNGQIIGKGNLNQFSENRLILTNAASISGDVVIGKTPESMSELEVSGQGSFHADGSLTVNATGVYVLPPGNFERNNFANLDTAIGWTSTGRTRFDPYTSNTTFGGTAYFNESSVWAVDIAEVRNGDNPGALRFAEQGFIGEDGELDAAGANTALNFANTMHFYSLEALNDEGVGYLNVSRNDIARVSDIFVNSMLLHNAGAIRTAVADRIDFAMYHMALDAKAMKSCDRAKTHRFSGNSVWMNYIGRTNLMKTSYIDSQSDRFTFKSHGVNLGFDILASKRFVLGTVFSYENHKGKLAAHNVFTDQVKSNDYSIGLYGGYRFDNCFDIRGSFGFGTQNYDVQRYQEFGLNPGVYLASSKGNTVEASFEIGRRFYCSGCKCKHGCKCQLSFRPVIGFDYYVNQIGGAQEKRNLFQGNQNYGLKYDSMQLNQMFLRVGSDVQRYWNCFRFSAGSYYSYLMNKDGSRLSAWASDEFHGNKVVGNNLGRNTITVNLGGNLFLNDERTISLFVNYEGDYFADRSGTPFGHNGIAGFQCRF